MGTVYYIPSNTFQARIAATFKTLRDRSISYVETRVLSLRSVFTLINYVNMKVYTNIKGDVKWQARQYLQ